MLTKVKMDSASRRLKTGPAATIGDPFPDRLFQKGPVLILRRQFFIGRLAEELHISAQRDQRQNVFRFPDLLADDPRAEPEGKFQDADADPLRHPKMTQFMGEDQDPQQNNYRCNAESIFYSLNDDFTGLLPGPAVRRKDRIDAGVRLPAMKGDHLFHDRDNPVKSYPFFDKGRHGHLIRPIEHGRHRPRVLTVAWAKLAEGRESEWDRDR